MVETSDGFVISERDLAIRGPGDYFGTRQSGVPLFRIADMVRDEPMRDEAKNEAQAFLESAEACHRPPRSACSATSSIVGASASASWRPG